MDKDKIMNWCKKNGKVLLGIAILFIGIILVIKSSEIIVNLILLLAGLFVIYYALYLLKLKKITDFIDGIIENIKNLFKQQ